MRKTSPILILLLLASAAAAPALAQGVGTLTGQVLDETGGALSGARIELRSQKGGGARATTDANGRYDVAGLRPGLYAVTVTKRLFVQQQRSDVAIAAGAQATLDFRLALAPMEERVTVDEGSGVSTDPEAGAGAIVLKGKDLEALPDDPDELADALQALAGPAAGPSGAQVYIDGFSGGRLPPRASIREIRINANPFSAQFDRMGHGRIEILTRPGTENWRGQASTSFNDATLNARDPFAANRPPYQRRRWELEMSGPLVPKKVSVAFEIEQRDVDDNAIVSAKVLDDNLSVVPFSQALASPQHRTDVSTRFDFQPAKASTLTARYEFSRNRRPQSGIGGYSLPSRAYESRQGQHTLQLTHTLTLGKKVINETRVMLDRNRSDQAGDDSSPTISVSDAFTGGGSQVGQSYSLTQRLEFQNYTSWAWGKHSLRVGVRVRGSELEDVSRQNFGGTVLFAGGEGPTLDAGGNVVLDAFGQPVVASLTSIERYRRTLLLQGQGLSAAAIRALGGGPSQLSIAGGDPLARVTQWDVAPFLQDDWRASPALTLSVGLRYENQNHIKSSFDLAPRVAFAWAPGVKSATDRSKTVVRGGVGIFYERFSENLTLQAERFDGISQQQYVVSDPEQLGLIRFGAQGVTDVPSVAALAAFAAPQAIRTVSRDLRAPYTVQTSLGLERQLSTGVTLSSVVVSTRSQRVLRSRNVNALRADGTYPLGTAESVYQYESTGRQSQEQLILGVNGRLKAGSSLFARYFLTRARGDSDGAGSFPSEPYDLGADYGRSAFDVRHRFQLGGSLALPAGVRVSPMVMISSGQPFNITTGKDNNGDTIFADRPAYATDATKVGVVATQYGLLDPNPAPGQPRIARNLGTGPGFVVFNLRLGKTIGFGPKPAGSGETPAGAPAVGGPGPGGGPPPGGGAGPGGGHGGGFGGHGGHGPGGYGGEGSSRKYSVSFSVSAQNIFNHVNRAAPVGNLTSPSFGQSTSTAGGFGRGGASGGRRIDVQARLSF